MRILIACEYSGVTRDAFQKIGFDAMSCDLLPSEIPGNHYIGDVFNIINDEWDMLIGFPPCTHLSVSGARWFKDRLYEQPLGIQFFHRLWDYNIPRIALENPVSIASTFIQKPTQTIQPHEFGCGEVKRTCLWLKNLPKLIPTLPVSDRVARVHKMAPSENRGKERARMYPGIAEAMAKQWGLPLLAGTL
jgi:hypothetical protein